MICYYLWKGLRHGGDEYELTDKSLIVKWKVSGRSKEIAFSRIDEIAVYEPTFGKPDGATWQNCMIKGDGHEIWMDYMCDRYADMRDYLLSSAPESAKKTLPKGFVSRGSTAVLEAKKRYSDSAKPMEVKVDEAPQT